MTSQTDKLFALLKDGQPHSTPVILERVYGGDHLRMARIAARVGDLKKRGYEFRGFNKNGIFHYQITNPPKKQFVSFEERNGVMTAVVT